MIPRTLMTVVLALLAPVLLAGPAGAGPAEDAYLRGYAAAVLERELRVTARNLAVRDGVITVPAGDLAGLDRERVVGVLAAIPGVARVEVVEAGPPTTVTTPAPAPGTTARTPGEAAPTPAAPAPPSLHAWTDKPLRQIEPLPTGFLPSGLLFDPLLADPRWPNFSAAYHRYIDDRDFANVAAVSFGETFPFYRARAPLDGQWEIGLQASVFAFFDLDAESFDLINADYFVGVPLSYRRGPFSGTLRFAHQSSHLGDEFLLRDRAVERRNISYESVDAKLSYDLFAGTVRLYGGGGYLIDTGRDSVDGLTAQYGLELLSPWALRRPYIRPVLAADFQHRQVNDWDVDVSVRAGLQFESIQVLGRKLLILLEYFTGHSPNGQFFERKIEYFGIGAHFYH